jgi:tetratricopeptide (TPR) repeat protein
VFLTVLSLPAFAAGRAPTTRPAADETKPSKAEQLFQDGRKALLTGHYARAVDLLRQAVSADETKTSYRLNLARAYHYAGKPAEAEAALKAILKTTPDHVEAGQLLARIHTARESWKEVLSVLEPLLKYRHDYTTYHLLAEAAYNLDETEKARKYFEEAIKLNARSATDHYQLGNIYLAGNFFALAAEMYQKALALGLDSPALRYKLGSAYFNLRNYFGQIRVVTVKAGKAGTISDGWYLIEPAPGKKDTFRAAPSDSAVYQIAKAVADGIGDRPDIQFLMANIYLNARRYREAYARLGKLKETIPKEDRALYYHYYSQAAFGVGKYEEYLELLGEAIKLDKAAYEPTLVEAYLKVAEQHNQAGDLKKYIHFVEKAVAASPQTAALHLKLGNACEEARQYDKAVVQWRMVLDLEPDHPQRMRLLNLMTRYKSQAKPAAKPS